MALSTASAAGGYQHAREQGENFLWSTFHGLADGLVEYAMESTFLKDIKTSSLSTAGLKEGFEEVGTGGIQNTRAGILENLNKGMSPYEAAKDAMDKSVRQMPVEFVGGFIGGYGITGGLSLTQLVDNALSKEAIAEFEAQQAPVEAVTEAEPTITPPEAVEAAQEPTEGKVEGFTRKELRNTPSEELVRIKQILEDQIATAKANKRQPQQAHLNRLADIDAILEDKEFPTGKLPTPKAVEGKVVARVITPADTPETAPLDAVGAEDQIVGPPPVKPVTMEDVPPTDVETSGTLEVPGESKELKPQPKKAVPQKAVPPTGQRRERGFVTSVKEEFPELETRVSGEYVPRSTDNLAIKARTLIQEDIASAERMARKGNDDAAVATAAELVKHYTRQANEATTQAEKDSALDKAMEITNESARSLTELGRAVQAASILSRNTPEGVLRFAQRTIQQHNEQVDAKRKRPAKRLIPQKKYDAARKRLNAIGKLSSGIDPQLFADLVTVGAFHVEDIARRVANKTVTFASWSRAMIKDLGDTVQPHLRTVWDEAQKDVAKVQNKVPEITTKQAADILKKADTLQKMPDGIDKAKAAQKITEEISELTPTPLFDKLITLWKAGLLTGIKTHGLNAMSNLFHGATEVVKDAPTVVIDEMASLFTGERTTALTIRGLTGGVKDGAIKGWDYLNTGFDERNIRAKLEHKKINMGTSSFAKWLQAYEETVFGMLGAADQPFYYGAKSRSLVSQALAQAKNKGLKGQAKTDFVDNLIANPTDEMLKYAVKDAEIAVFQNATQLGLAAAAAKRAVPGLEVILPFSRTPSAVAMQMINYSPIGAAKTVIENIGKGKFDQRAFAQGLGRSITGTAVLVIGSKLLTAGLLTLDRPKDERERELWKREGRKPNSIKIGDKWRDVQVLGPAGPVLLIGGYFQRGLDDTGSLANAMVQATTGAGKALTEQTFLTGVNRTAEAIKDPARSFESWFSGIAGSVVPTIVSDTARALDDKARRSVGPIQRIKGRIPVLRETLEPRIDVFGQDVPRYGGNTLEIMIDPTRPFKVRNDVVVDELRRLWDADVKVSPTLLGDKEGYEILTPEQNTKLWRRAGDLVYQNVFNKIKSKEYNLKSDLSERVRNAIQGKMIEQSILLAKNQARIELGQEVRASRKFTDQQILESGLEPITVPEIPYLMLLDAIDKEQRFQEVER